MTFLVFVLLLVVLALALQTYARNHALDDLKASMMPEDLLAEPGQPARLCLTLRNQKGWPRPLVAVKLHLGPEFEGVNGDFIQKDLLSSGHTVRYVTWLKPHQ